MVLSCVWEERGGRTSDMAMKFAWIRACVKLNYQITRITRISKDARQKKNGQLW